MSDSATFPQLRNKITATAQTTSQRWPNHGHLSRHELFETSLISYSPCKAYEMSTEMKSSSELLPLALPLTGTVDYKDPKDGPE